MGKRSWNFAIDLPFLMPKTEIRIINFAKGFPNVVAIFVGNLKKKIAIDLPIIGTKQEKQLNML